MSAHDSILCFRKEKAVFCFAVFSERVSGVFADTLLLLASLLSKHVRLSPNLHVNDQKICNTNMQWQTSKRKKKKSMLLSDSVCSISLTAESFAAGWVRDAWGGGFDTKALPCFNNLTTACSESPFHFPDFEVWQKVCWHYIFINRVTPCCLWMEHVNPLRS